MRGGGVVLADPVGKPRPYWRGLLLSVATFGVYAVYWNYRAHGEVYRQFELAREGRDEGTAWYVLGLVVQPFLLAYFWIMASNVDYVRRRIGLPRRSPPGRFVGLIGLAAGVFVVGLVAAEIVYSRDAADAPESEEAFVSAPAVATLIGALLASVVIAAFAFHGLQHSMNELWAAYHARMAYLRANPDAPAAEPSPVVQAFFPQPRYMADLAPREPAVAASAPQPLAAEWARLRAEHPDVAPLAGLEPAVRRAEEGDASARMEAESELARLVPLLEERKRLLSRRHEVVARLRNLDEQARAGTGDVASYDASVASLEAELADVDDRLGALERQALQV